MLIFSTIASILAFFWLGFRRYFKLLDVSDIEDISKMLVDSRIGQIDISSKFFGITKLSIRHKPVIQVEVAPEPVIKTTKQVVDIVADMVGTFRWARTAEETPLTFTCRMLNQTEDIPIGYIGREVKTGEVIGYINALKLDTEVLSPVDGRIVGEFIMDDKPVEYGQLLLKIEES